MFPNSKEGDGTEILFIHQLFLQVNNNIIIWRIQTVACRQTKINKATIYEGGPGAISLPLTMFT